MANASGGGTTWNLPNYTGEVFLLGKTKTPFLNMLGGLQGNRIHRVSTLEFDLAQPWNLETAAQPAITETASLTAPTATSYVRSQDKNTVQIFQKKVSVSYVKQATSGIITADSTTNHASSGGNPVSNELAFQQTAALRQVSVDAEHTFLNGTYQQSTNAGVAAKTRGIVTACSSNTVAAGSTDLAKSQIDELLREMATSGAPFDNPVIFVNALQKQRLSALYAYAPTDRNVGGVNINQIETDFAVLGVVYAPFMDTSKMLIADMSVCRPVFCPVPEKGDLFYEMLSKTGAGEDGQVYGMMGLDYGPEEFHGTITGLTTS